MMILEKVTIEDLPTCFNRIIRYEDKNFKCRIMVTDNILVPGSDGTFDINVYCDWLKVIGSATDGVMHFRWESPLIRREDIESVWRKEVNNFFDAVKAKFGIII